MSDFWMATLRDLIVCSGACVSMSAGLLAVRWIDGKLSPLAEIVTVWIGRKIGGKVGGRLVSSVYDRLQAESDHDLLVAICKDRRS